MVTMMIITYNNIIVVLICIYLLKLLENESDSFIEIET